MTLPLPFMLDPSLPTDQLVAQIQGDLDEIARHWEVVTTPKAATGFVNGWRNVLGGGGANQDARYWRDRNNIVHIEGMVDKNGGNWVAAEPIFTLDAGFRPAKNQTFPSAMSSNGFAVHNVGHIDVLSSGIVQVGFQGGAANPVSMASLAGISFVAGV